MKTRKIIQFGAIALASSLPVTAYAADTDSESLMQEIDAMKQRISELESDLADSDQVQKADDEDGIKVGGAVRFQYSYEDYNDGNTDRVGDVDMDTFRLNLDGEIGGVILSAEWRWYQYMNVVHHAYVGYDLSEDSQIQAGINQVPFGITPYNSHNFFFSSNYYLGLEDDYDFGLKYLWDKGPWDAQAAFYFNDEQGGVDGYVNDRTDRYSYDVIGVRTGSEGIYDAPAAQIAENNTINLRLAYTFDVSADLDIELGASAQQGDMHDGTTSVGDQSAYAIHLVGDYGPWNLQLQTATYEYDLDSGEQVMVVGAYSFFDSIAAEADIHTANIAYSLPVSFGPVTNLTFYNDYSIVTGKSAGLEDTTMNVTGVAISAGGVYAYVDFINATNQPFIGGTMVGNGGSEQRFNINVGYYF